MLAVLLAPGARAANCNAIKVWSFNVRFDDGWSSCFSDGENQWFKGGAATARRDVARAFLTAYSPDIFGLQEVKNPAPFATTRASQLRDIASWFPKHGYYALDRGDGEHCAIFLRVDRFTPFDMGTFWMSCTPDVPSKHPRETGNFRITSWVRLIDNYAGTDFYVFNSHWPLDSAARDYSAALIRERISRIAAGAPVILLGDFNCAESDSPFDILLGTRTYPPSSDCSVQPGAVPTPSLPLVNSPTFSSGSSFCSITNETGTDSLGFFEFLIAPTRVVKTQALARDSGGHGSVHAQHVPAPFNPEEGRQGSSR